MLFYILLFPYIRYLNSKRHNKLLFSALAKSIYASFCKSEMAISNVVNYKKKKHTIFTKNYKKFYNMYEKKYNARLDVC